MLRLRAYWPGLAILAAVLVLHGAALWPELEWARAQTNDYTSHLAIAKRIVTAVERGENPLDCWSSEFSLGYPQVRTYMIFPHLAVAGVYFALGKTVSIENVFLMARWLAVFAIPIGFFVCAAWLRLGPWVAAAAAAIAPLVATDRLFGIDYASFTSRGWGLFSQAVATSFLLLAIGYGDRALKRRGSVTLAGVLLGCTFLSHFIYGYMGAVSLVLLTLVRRARVARLAGIGVVSAALCAHQIVPLLEDGRFLNHSRWEHAFKWNSYGAEKVLGWLFSGQLLDFGRLPVVTLLAAAGVALAGWELARLRRLAPRRAFLMSGAALWIALYCGRPFWGRGLAAFAITRDFHLHRLIGGAQIFLVLLAATALAAVWRAASRRGMWSAAAGFVATAALLYPAVAERAQYLSKNYQETAETAARFDNMQAELDGAAALVRQRGGRVYPLDMSQNGTDVLFADSLELLGLPIVPFVGHSMGLTSEMMVIFKGRMAEQYRQYNVRTHLLYGAYPDPRPFLNPLPPIGRIQAFDAPGTGYFDVVEAPVAVPTTREDFLDINQRWIMSEWPRKNAHLWLDFGDAPRDVPRVNPAAELAAAPVDGTGSGKVAAERRRGEVYEADYEAARDAFVIFRMTWHPNWKIYMDGRAEKTMMLSPGVIGVRTASGRHHVMCRYEPGLEKIALLAGGVVLIGLCGYFERRTRRRQIH